MLFHAKTFIINYGVQTRTARPSIIHINKYLPSIRFLISLPIQLNSAHSYLQQPLLRQMTHLIQPLDDPIQNLKLWDRASKSLIPVVC